MIYMVWLPLLVPFLAGPAGRRLVACLPPAQAAWLLTITAAGLALGSTTALALLVIPGATRLHAVATLGRLLTPLATGSPDSVVAVALAASGLLAWCAFVLVRGLYRRLVQLREARRLAARAGSELVVLADDFPDAYALPGRPGRIVATSGMLRALSPAEREALLAHERAHLTGRHHRFTAVVELAALCHPALRALREPLVYALERSADEHAAHAVGDRRLTAQAIGKAALAVRAARAACPAAARRRPGIALAATAGPVPRRVAALLDQHSGTARTRRDTRIAIAAALLACLALSATSAVEAADDLHTSIEVAQGELPR
ncbi:MULTISPECIES: M56 family metallopeptidase [unclassified Streptomyces]|uniref:M56 family metallopeptidase n=1 Tax=unclassified Streptomyces TaxID=2593676 RepID=UPI002E332E15|nr:MULTISPECIES: M56 family metallopeptidase [unclassified Streptomyces]WUC62850.1 M56 family metallopeptidase [Streptomyces sp. NBC_00539]